MATAADAVPDSAPSALVDLPIVGRLVEPLDRLLVDLGVPFWSREAMELAGVGAASFLVLRWLLRHGLPWLGGKACGPAAVVFDLLARLMLLPDLIVTRVMDRLGRTPPGILYAYGDAVLSGRDRATSAAQGVLRNLGVLRRVPGILLVTVLVTAFAYWNSEHCAAPAGGTCTSPVVQWRNAVQSWADEQAA